jgi:RNA polymerase sigma factor (sigma-70 family)
MCTKDCEPILKSTTSQINEGFKNAVPYFSEKLIACFYNCYKNIFTKWAFVMYKKYNGDTIAFLSNSAFTDCVLKFKEAAILNKLYDSNKSAYSILFGYYKKTLLSHLQTEKRLIEKQERFNKTNNSAYTFIENDELFLNEKKFNLMEDKLNKMATTDKQIIVWRHLELKTVDEISSILGITKEATSNRIYRCMERLRNLIEKTNQWNGNKC